MKKVKVSRTYPIAGNIKFMGAVTENGKDISIYYSDGYSPELGHPISFELNKFKSAVIGQNCIYKDS